MARSVTTTKQEIIHVATELFLEKGVSATSPKMIADKLDISTGNITYYFHTKEHLLAVLADMLCEFQGKMMEEKADDGVSSIMAICLEFAAMAAMCEENEIAKDFYLSTYASDLCLEIIQRNDMNRAKEVFRAYRPDWTDEQFAEAEIIVSGIEQASFRTNELSPVLETRISGAVDLILFIYGVPEETRKMKIDKVLAMDYREISRGVFQRFKEFVAETTEQKLEEMLLKIRKKNN